MLEPRGPGKERMPRWLRRPLAERGSHERVEALLGQMRLNTVCRKARCPNRGECYSSGNATFLVLGERCTRECRFCAIPSGALAHPDPDEPRRVAEAAKRMGLRHVVTTMVTRDDLPDGGASHVAAVLAALQDALPAATREVLTSDFGGDLEAVSVVLDAGPDVYNHNVETVPRLYATVRPGADYQRSLGVLERAAGNESGVVVKSGIMLGLGETRGEVRSVMEDLRAEGCTALTLGQYLRPGPACLPIQDFVEPRVFEELEQEALSLGFESVASGPLVRSSYRAERMVVAADGTIGTGT